MTGYLEDQSWESNDGAAVDVMYRPDRSRSVRMQWISDEGEEIMVFMDETDFDRLAAFLSSFAARIATVNK